MILSIASGKGGTGKTTLAVNLASLLKNVALLDCDVEEPNAHIFLKPQIASQQKVELGLPTIDDSLCDYCGRCAEFCRFNALAVFGGKTAMVFSEICHHCGGCALVCPQKAITETPAPLGRVDIGRAGHITFLQGVSDVGVLDATPVIRRERELTPQVDNVVIDAPPGTSCLMIEAVEGSDFCLLVTEPTPFGLHDLRAAAETVRLLDVPFGVVVNQAGIGDGGVYEYCDREKIPVLLRIPYDRRIAECYSNGHLVVERIPEYVDPLCRLLERLGLSRWAGEPV
jgi:MinD superfamily P-loop ATPase